jgi:hypothetical protein
MRPRVDELVISFTNADYEINVNLVGGNLGQRRAAGEEEGVEQNLT